MKISIDRYMMTALACALMLAAGCSREENQPAEGPDALVACIADGVLETRTSYAGADGKFKWNDGDQIKVHYQDGRFEAMDLAVDTSDPAKAVVLSSVVGTKVRDFYAVYPASAAVTPASGATAPKVTLPDSYDISAIVTGSSPLTWDYSPLPLVAENVPGEDLQFHHVGGLLRVICRDLDPSTKKVAVRFDKDITGTYSVNVTDPDEPFITCSGANTGKNTVTFTVASSAAGIGASVTALTLNVPVPCGTYGNLQVEALDNAGATLFVREYQESEMTFERHHGKRIAFAEQTVEFVLDASLEAVNTDADGGMGVLVRDSFTSYGSNADGNTFPIPFALEYGPTASGPWTREAPDWLTPGAGIDFGGGETPQRIEVAVAPLKNLIETNRNGIPLDERTLRLQNASPATNFDLSTRKVSTGETVSRTTANCYVVQAPGTYRFPVAYGNSIQNGADTESSYHVIGRDADVTDINDQCVLLGYYKDHLGQDIHYPYLADQLSHKSPALSISEAKLLWMDAPGLVKDVQYHPGSAGSDYISFRIEKEDICQGNAVIAVFDNNTPKRIAWSWHIWVTDEDLTVKKEGGMPGKYLSNTNLGHCNKREMERYADRSCYVRLVQDIPDGKVSDAVAISSTAAPTVIRYANSTFYGWGRKDPFPGSDGNMDAPADKACYPTRDDGNEYYPVFGVNEPATLSSAIQNPHLQHIGDWVVWSSPSYANCWTSTLNYGTNDAPETVKTVYDPCPVGFKVPNELMFKNLFTEANHLPPFVWQELDENGETPGILRESDGLFFPALGYRGQALDAVGSGGFYESANGYLERAWDRFVWDRTRFNRSEEASCASSTNLALMVRPMFE